ncbi:polyprenyl synthetase family protein [Fervidibacillus halotolerans]|uniref:Farnesyl diphosphate synthase n=1 Tax=Fervidibacillus halotolerans TaxID=2980027 RepID=A0A9E8S007_9BACI|nr:farnesyl diphosphate synthase [Fervidibacillus halotolerans]WAA13923.1 polyprenyl synthetase family protein [Fervidibacillus halotolerans]
MKPLITLLNEELSKNIQNLHMPDTLKQSMIYSLEAGGKRIRPLLIFATLDAFGMDGTYGLPVAISVEMIHTYSLIHDDLPSMDNDDLRRGKPTNHKVFGEAMAILAGDGLLTYSFQLLSEIPSSVLPCEKKIVLIRELAKASGPEGMVGGQVADLEGENQQLSIHQLQKIHANKTGKLLTFCVKAGAILADADQETTEKLEQFAYHIGLAFQIQDDILDIEGEPEKIGKQTGSDKNKNKSTYPSLLTLNGAKEKLNGHVTEAKRLLAELPLHTKKLEMITDLIGSRDH